MSQNEPEYTYPQAYFFTQRYAKTSELPGASPLEPCHDFLASCRPYCVAGGEGDQRGHAPQSSSKKMQYFCNGTKKLTSSDAKFGTRMRLRVLKYSKIS